MTDLTFDKDLAEEAALEAITLVLTPERRKARVIEVRAVALMLARSRPITTDELYRYYADKGIDLHEYLGNAKALAGVFIRKFFEPVGWRKSSMVRCHARPKRIWRLK